MNIEIHPLTGDPTAAWDSMRFEQVHRTVTPLDVDTPLQPGNVRFVCISDTHSRQRSMKHPIPNGDVLIHAGDFTCLGDSKEIADFESFLALQPHQYKIVIAGNHEMSFDPVLHTKSRRKSVQNAIYLEDSEVEVCGIKIYGSPWQPAFGSWAFNLKRGQQSLDKWNLIPEDTDILITHGPPLGHGDLCKSYLRAGCVELLSTIQKRVKPKYHIFGHVHEGYGVTTDGQTTFINCSICTRDYRPTNPPVIFDFPLSEIGKKMNAQAKEEITA